MKSLGTLIKLQKSKVDDQRRALADQQMALDKIDRQMTELAIQQAKEQEAARDNPEGTMAYGAFAQWAVKRGRELARARQLAERAVDIARVKLAELFEEQKRYEIIQANRQAEKEKAENRAERMELDETAAVNHERKQHN